MSFGCKRVYAHTEGERFLYPNQYVEFRLNGVGPGGWMTKYYYMGSQRLAMKDEDDDIYFFVSDHLGSTALTLRSNGGVHSEQRYKPFGETRYTAQSATPTRRQFTGQINDVGTGLYFYNARYYDPALGRFTQADTIVPEPGNPQTLNRFSYVSNNPLKYTDPSGHCPAPLASLGPTICVALFIQDAEVSAGPYKVHGDGRTFSSNSAPEQSRGYIWISLDESGKVSGYQWAMNDTGYIVGGTIIWEEPSDANNWLVTQGENGEISVSYDLVIAGPLEDLGWAHINGQITFRPNGEGGYGATGRRDGYPWAEAYYHDGQGDVQTIFQRTPVGPAPNPNNLGAIEPRYFKPRPLHQQIFYFWRRQATEKWAGFIPQADDFSE